MLIRMLTTRNCAPDGVHIQRLEKGEQYTLPHGIAKLYVERGFAEPAGPLAAPEDRNAGASPETKIQSPRRRTPPRPRKAGK